MSTTDSKASNNFDLELESEISAEEIARVTSDSAHRQAEPGDSNEYEHLSGLNVPSQPDAAAVKKSQLPLIIGGVALMFTLLGSVVFVGAKIMGGGAGTASGGSVQAPEPAAVRAPTNGLAQTNQAVSDISAALTDSLTPLPVSEPESVSHVAPEASSSSPPLELAEATLGTGESIHPDPVSARDGVAVMTSHEGADVALSPPPLSIEEKAYDAALATIPENGVPAEAIKIDQSVIRRQVETGKINAFEKDLVTTRERVDGFDLKITELHKTVSDSAKSQDHLSRKFSEIETQLRDDKRARDAQMKEMQLALVEQKKLNERVLRQLEGKSASEQKVAGPAAPSVTRPREATIAKAKPVVEVVAPAPKPVKVAEGNSAQKSNSSCSAGAVSSIWRVKALSGSQAYVERVQDKEGLLLREGSELPGFGIVKSFDSRTRTVCTTSGVVGR